MTREETQKLLMAIGSLYPNFKPEDKTLTIDSWHWALGDYPAPMVKASLQVYVKTNNTGFAPSVSQLIGCMYQPSENGQLTEADAWNMVKRALQDSTYHANERFEEFPEIVKKAVGSANMLQQWAQSETSEVNTVIMSNFQRAYRTVAERERFDAKVSPQLGEHLKGLVEMAGERMLEDGLQDN